jgi:hypothetical protein
MDLLWEVEGEESFIGFFDKTIWGVKDYTLLQHTVHAMITIYPNQNQRIENHMQLVALVCKTNVGQARAMARAMVHSRLLPCHKVDSVAAKKAKIPDKTKRDESMRTKDKKRVLGFSNYMDRFDKICR